MHFIKVEESKTILYEDDGLSRDYDEKRGFSKMQFNYTNPTANTVRITIGASVGKYAGKLESHNFRSIYDFSKKASI